MLGLIRTYVVFTDLPVHVELAMSPLPLLEQGAVVEFGEIRVPHPSEDRSWSVGGPHFLSRRKLTYTSKDGLSQYLEFSEVRAEGG